VRVKEWMRRRPALAVSVAVAVSLASLVALVLVVSRGLPPRIIVMTTGPEGSAYQEFGEKYRAALARDGIRLKLEPSKGNVENLARLKDASSGVSVGFVAGGLTSEKASPEIESLGAVAYDPIWVFCQGLPEGAQFGDLRGRRISIDPGAGVMPELLHATGLEKEVTVVPLAPAAGGEALVKREIDCACMLTVAEDPVVKKLLANESVKLMSFRRADAYVALFPSLNKVTVPRGVASLGKDLPPEDVTLVAPKASLLVRGDLHPALQYLLLQAAEEIHSSAGMLNRPGQFPAAEPGDVPLPREARNFYKSGGSFFQRNLPFWLGVFVSRLFLVLVPLIGLLYPLLRVLPLVIHFAFERRVTALYAELRRIDARIAAGEPAGEIATDLERLDGSIGRTRVAPSRARELYALRHHASLVRDKLLEARPSAPPA
jgi:TRAP-type uncharacterized transport system substrate-binding protein